MYKLLDRSPLVYIRRAVRGQWCSFVLVSLNYHKPLKSKLWHTVLYCQCGGVLSSGIFYNQITTKFCISKLDPNHLLVRIGYEVWYFTALKIFILYNEFYLFFPCFGMWEILSMYDHSWTSLFLQTNLACGDFVGHLFYCDVYRCRLGMQCILVPPCAMRCIARSCVYYICFSVHQYILLYTLPCFQYIPLVYRIRTSIQ